MSSLSDLPPKPDLLKLLVQSNPELAQCSYVDTLLILASVEYESRECAQTQIPVEHMLPPNFLCNYFPVYYEIPPSLEIGHLPHRSYWRELLYELLLNGCSADAFCQDAFRPQTHSMDDWAREVIGLKDEGFWFTYEVVDDDFWTFDCPETRKMEEITGDAIARLAASMLHMQDPHNLGQNFIGTYYRMPQLSKDFYIDGTRIDTILGSTLTVFTKEGRKYHDLDSFVHTDEFEEIASGDPKGWLYPTMGDDFKVGKPRLHMPGKVIWVTFDRRHYVSPEGRENNKDYPVYQDNNKGSFRIPFPVVDIVEYDISEETGEELISPHPHLESFSRKFLNFLESDQLTRVCGTLHFACNCRLCREAQAVYVKDHLLKTQGEKSLLVLTNSAKRRVKASRKIEY